MLHPALVPFALGCALAAAWDVRWRRIPNGLVLALAAMGLVAQAAQGGPLSAAIGLAGAVTGAAVLLGPFVLGWVGGGDVKLLGAIGMWLGPLGVLEAALGGLALAGLVALGMTLVSPGLRREVTTHLMMAAGGVRVQPERRAAARTVPLGAALAAGAVVTALVSGGLSHA